MSYIGYSQSSLINDILILKSNKVSDEIILAYIKAQETKKETENKTRTINIESYDYFVRYYLHPRTLAARNRILSGRNIRH